MDEETFSLLSSSVRNGTQKNEICKLVMLLLFKILINLEVNGNLVEYHEWNKFGWMCTKGRCSVQT